MAFPQVQSITETTTASATVHNISMPATVNAGDLLLIVVMAGSTVINSHPSGWTKLRDSTQTPVYLKNAVGDEDGTTISVGTSSSTSMAFQVYRITGWYDSGTILNDVELATTTGSSTSPNPPSLNPTNWGAEDTLWIACAVWAAGFSVTGYPSSYTDGLGTSSAGGRVATARRENNTASEDPGTFSIETSVGWRVHTIGIRPDPGAILFDGSAEVSFDGTAAMDVVSDIVFAGSETVSFDGTAQVTQIAVMDGAEEVSFDGTAVLSGGAVLLIGDGAVSFDGTAVLNQSAVFAGFADVDLNGLASLGVIREFAASQSVTFDGEATLRIIGWQDVDSASSQIWTVKK